MEGRKEEEHGKEEESVSEDRQTGKTIRGITGIKYNAIKVCVDFSRWLETREAAKYRKKHRTQQMDKSLVTRNICELEFSKIVNKNPHWSKKKILGLIAKA